MDANDQIAELKKKRPLCLWTWNGDHIWIVYDSEHYQQCHECGYREKLITKRT